MRRKNSMIVAVLIVIAVGYFAGKSKDTDDVTTTRPTQKEITSASNTTTHVDPTSKTLNPSKVESNQVEPPVEPPPYFPVLFKPLRISQESLIQNTQIPFHIVKTVY